MDILRYFGTENPNKLQFSPLGHVTADGCEYEVAAFMPLSEEPASGFEGLAWLDTRDSAIHRILLKLPNTPTTTVDVIYNSVRFDRAPTAIWLPGSAAVSTRGIRLESLSVHRFSDYEQSGGSQGSVLNAQDRLPSAVELLGQVSEMADGPAKDALLQRAAALDPKRPETHFQIAIGLWRKKALAGAERELREALNFAPDAFAVHNLLAIVLFGENDLAGAVSEFRTSLALNGGNATAHFNLAEAFEKSGDATAAFTGIQKGR